MGFFKKLFGICETAAPQNSKCWSLSEGVVELQLNQAPELSQDGGAVRLEGEGLDPRLLVLKGVDGEFHAFGNNCACSGWRIDPVEGEEKVHCCTLMNSTYDYNGKRLSGSAEKDLIVFPVEVEGEKLIIRLS